MKIHQLFEANPEQQVWDLNELVGKKLTWEKAIKFIAKLPYVENNSPNKSIFEVKKNVKFNMAKLIKLLNEMDPSIKAEKWSTRKFHVSYNYDHPVAGKILYAPSSHAEYMKMSKEDISDSEEEYSKLIISLRNKERDKLSDKGAAGWYMDHGGSNWRTDFVGEFTEGPTKGRYFCVNAFAKKSNLSVGDEVKVTFEPTYGRVKLER